MNYFYGISNRTGLSSCVLSVRSYLEMLRTRTFPRCLRPPQQSVWHRQRLAAIKHREVHLSTCRRQENEPHGPPIDELPKVPIVNPADKYKEDGERLHEYGTYLLTTLPKYIQRFR